MHALSYLYRIIRDKIILIIYFIIERLCLLLAGTSCGIIILFLLRGQFNWTDYRLVAALCAYPIFEFTAIRLTFLRQKTFRGLKERCNSSKYSSTEKKYSSSPNSLYRKLHLYVFDYDTEKYVKYAHVSYSLLLAIIFSSLHISFFLLLVSISSFVVAVYTLARQPMFALNRNEYTTVVLEFYSLFKGVPKLLPSMCLFFILLLGLGVSSLVSSMLNIEPPSWFISLFALLIFRQIFASLRILFLRTNAKAPQEEDP